MTEPADEPVEQRLIPRPPSVPAGWKQDDTQSPFELLCNSPTEKWLGHSYRDGKCIRCGKELNGLRS